MTSSRTSMDAFLRLFAVVAAFTLAHAGPRYIAIPIDGVDVIELNPIGPPSLSASPRLPRQTADAYVPVAVSSLHHANGEPTIQLEQIPQVRPERATAHILDYVDFGAHTGPNGAFSWYADYPSHH